MLDSSYVVGLVDGEGSFTFRLNANPKRRNRMEPRFYIKLQDRDKSLLDELRQFFGCGKVYFQRDVRPNHRNCYRFEVGNRYDLLNRIVPFFKENFLKAPTKHSDFERFCEAMELYARGDHLTKDGMIRLQEIKSKMH